jgi:hypothetical protein
LSLFRSILGMTRSKHPMPQRNIHNAPPSTSNIHNAPQFTPNIHNPPQSNPNIHNPPQFAPSIPDAELGPWIAKYWLSPGSYYLAKKVSELETLENLVYGVVNDALIHHKRDIPSRFIINPQLHFKWKPEIQEGTKSETPDFCLINYTLPDESPPYFVRCGIEIKRPMALMETLPSPDQLLTRPDVALHFLSVYTQSEDQAKAAFKNECCFITPIPWILAVGPYWTCVQFGPFTEAQLTVRTHKKADSESYKARIELNLRNGSQSFKLPFLDIFGTKRSYQRLENIIKSTDKLAEELVKFYKH